MNEVWNLDPIYKGFDDPAYQADLAAMKELVADFTAFAANLDSMEPLEGLRRGIEMQEKLADLGSLGGYASLRSATNAKDPEPGSWMGQVMAVRSGMAAPMAAFNAWVVSLPNLMELVRGDEYLKDYEFYFSGKLESAQYQMGGEAEAVMAKLKTSSKQNAAERIFFIINTPYFLSDNHIDHEGSHRLSALPELGGTFPAHIQIVADQEAPIANQALADGTTVQLFCGIADRNISGNL